VVPS
jgi:hypothetical protein